MKGNWAEKHDVTQSSGFKRLTRCIGCQTQSSIDRQAVMNDQVQPHILHYLGKRNQRVMKYMCSEQVGE